MDAIEALAEAWASMDGRLDQFLAAKSGALPDEGASYQGYMVEAEEMARRIAARGYVLTPLAGGEGGE